MGLQEESRTTNANKTIIQRKITQFFTKKTYLAETGGKLYFIFLPSEKKSSVPLSSKRQYQMKWNDPEYEEKEILEAFEKIILKNITERSLTNAWIATKLSISERKLYRDIHNLTGMSPNQYIRKIKMGKALEILESGHYKQVKQVARSVGFLKAEYFSTLFKEEFGYAPSEILRNGHAK